MSTTASPICLVARKAATNGSDASWSLGSAPFHFLWLLDPAPPPLSRSIEVAIRKWRDIHSGYDDFGIDIRPFSTISVEKISMDDSVGAGHSAFKRPKYSALSIRSARYSAHTGGLLLASYFSADSGKRIA